MVNTCCKVGFVVHKRNLDKAFTGESLDSYLVARWLGREGYTDQGLRPLTDWFNRNLLKIEYLENDRSATETRIESEYEALRHGDDIVKGEVLDDLKADGIAGSKLVDDFISKSTLQRHLTKCLGVEKALDGGGDKNWEQRKIEYTQDSLRENVEEALKSLENKGKLPGVTEAKVDLPVMLRCPECNTRVRFRTATERGYICEAHLGSDPEAGD